MDCVELSKAEFEKAALEKLKEEMPGVTVKSFQWTEDNKNVRVTITAPYSHTPVKSQLVDNND